MIVSNIKKIRRLTNSLQYMYVNCDEVSPWQSFCHIRKCRGFREKQKAFLKNKIKPAFKARKMASVIFCREPNVVWISSLPYFSCVTIAYCMWFFFWVSIFIPAKWGHKVYLCRPGRQWHLPPSLITWVWSLEPKCGRKEPTPASCPPSSTTQAGKACHA